MNSNTHNFKSLVNALIVMERWGPWWLEMQQQIGPDFGRHAGLESERRPLSDLL